MRPAPPGVPLASSTSSERVAARRLVERVVPLIVWPGIYNAQELSALLGFPIDAVAIPGLVLGRLPITPRLAIGAAPRHGGDW